MLITTKVLLDALLSFCGSLTLLTTTFVVIGAVSAYQLRTTWREAGLVTFLLKWWGQLTGSMLLFAALGLATQHHTLWSVTALAVYGLAMGFMAWERWTGKIVTE